MQAPPSVVGVGASSDASAPLENELREIVTKLQQSFTQLIHQNASIIGESYEDKNVVDEGEAMDADLAELLEIGGAAAPAVTAAAIAGAGGGSSGGGGGGGGGGTGGLAGEKLKFVPPRKSIPVQKLSYSQLQASALKQSYQTSVNAHNLVHHAHSLLGLVGRLKLSVLLAKAAQDASRQERDGKHAADPAAAAAAAPSLRHPLEAAIHPSTIPAHLLPLHLQRTQQQLHDTGLELYSQVCEIDRQLEDATIEAAAAATAATARQDDDAKQQQ